MAVIRQPQQLGAFDSGNPDSGYYNDLRIVAETYGTPAEAMGWLDLCELRREGALPVSILQLGLGAWQHVRSGADPAWQQVCDRVVAWALLDMDAYGRLAHYMPMPHTYAIDPPWYSAMAQGQLVSLLVRAATGQHAEQLLRDARRAATSLLDPVHGLVVVRGSDVVLQEYPANPAPDVLNGWIFGLWGLHDLGLSDAQSQDAFVRGCDTLERLLPEYELAGGWSRYDRYPHPVVNVASPFYHRLHVAQLRALYEMTGRSTFQEYAERWEAALERPMIRTGAVLRKIGFRMVRPRRRQAG
jgi:heparosan-N-sulfate-glucuronate 5-epimerase